MEPVRRTIPARDGVKLFTQVFEKGSNVWLIATHGIGEHLDRHSYLQNLCGHDVNIFQYDLRGHGRSSGEKAYIHNFEQFYQDLEDCVAYLRDKYEMKNYILFGHSMGALITYGFVKKYLSENSQLPLGVIINAPPVAIPGALGKLVDLIPDNILFKGASLKASLPLGGLVNLKYLSHRPEVGEEYVLDKFNHLKLHTKLLLEMVKASRDIFSSKLEIDIPLYCSFGSKDGIVEPSAIKKYFTEVQTKVTLKAIDGAYHEIHNELDKFRVPYFDFLKSCINSLIYKDQ